MSLTAVLPAAAHGATATMQMSAPLPGDAASLATQPQHSTPAATATLTGAATAAEPVATTPAETPAGRAATTATAMRPSPPARRRVLLAIIAGIALLATAFILANMVAASTASPTPAPVDYPTVDGPLGDHLTQLQDSVAP